VLIRGIVDAPLVSVTDEFTVSITSEKLSEIDEVVMGTLVEPAKGVLPVNTGRVVSIVPTLNVNDDGNGINPDVDCIAL
jgi:hypothetical protein